MTIAQRIIDALAHQTAGIIDDLQDEIQKPQSK